LKKQVKPNSKLQKGNATSVLSQKIPVAFNVSVGIGLQDGVRGFLWKLGLASLVQSRKDAKSGFGKGQSNFSS
jgi:hypothetical protein